MIREATIDEYLDRAIATQKLNSDRDLSLRLGLNPGAVHMFRSRKAWPSDGTMIRIAQMAGVDPGGALLFLNYWRERDPDAKKEYQTLAETITQARRAGADLPKLIPVLAGLIVAGGLVLGEPAQAAERTVIKSTSPAPELYIMRV